MIGVVPEGLYYSIISIQGTSRELTNNFMTVPGPLANKQIKPNRELGGAYCEVSGIWYPKSLLRKDGYGRIVGVDFWVPGKPEPIL